MSPDPRVAIVTGASSGIGRAVALALARDGHHVLAVARRQDRLDELVRAGGADAAGGGSISPFVADVTAEGAGGEMVARALERHGRLDVLVNAAGYGVNAASESAG
ncbi:SDR family NAD(P)-dependent oxidoreductase [Microbacterium sp. 10M-3C3]|jgi:NAD(P)-dependent dehydrogenase (short-subunit alcohol dehydrogenase family)|uniref:SDR family oxidoreductase n=1 Tax=Microbacterium sp. 10M-3C3 TaxID=2483401 RepID=UPI000F6439E1|nr:SDR family NAD(P)-dependent oxidoreductase [Microbacterium sp. 10M-3C3]